MKKNVIKYVLFAAVALSLNACAFAAEEPAPAEKAAPADEGVKVDVNEKEELDFAEGLFSRGMYDMAIEAYKKFLGDYPGSRFAELADYRMGESLFLGKKYKEAVSAFDDFVKKYPSGEFVLRAELRKGQAHLLLGEYDQAEKEFAALAEKKEPALIASAAFYYLGRLYLEKNDSEKAKSAFEKLVSDFPGNEYIAFAYMNLGDICMKAEDFQKAISYYQLAKGTDAENIKGQADLRTGDAYYLSGEFEKARASFREAMASSADDVVVENAAVGILSSFYNEGRFKETSDSAGELLGRIKTGNIKAQMLFIYGNSLFYQNRYEEAGKVYGELAREYPDTPYGKKARLNETWALFRSGDKKKSLETVDSYLSGGAEGRDEALFMKGKLLSEMSKFDEAMEIYTKIMKEYPASPFFKDALLETALLYNSRGDAEKAALSFREFSEKFPDDPRAPEVLLKTGQGDLKMKKYEEAERVYKLFLEKYAANPLKEQVLYQLGNVYIQAENYDALIETYENFLKEYPDSLAKEFVYYWTGRAYQEKGEWDKAIAYFDGASRDRGSDFYTVSQEAMAFALYRKGDDAGAARVSYNLMVEKPDFKMNEDVYRWVADHYFKNGDSAKSLAVLELHEKYYPDSDTDGVLAFMFAEDLRTTGDLEKAEKYYRKIIEKDPTSKLAGRVYLGLGRIYSAKKEYEKALSDLAESLKFHDDNYVGAYARFEIGNVKSETGDFEEAAKSYAMVAILYNDPTLCPEAYYKAAEAFQKADMGAKSMEMLKELVEKYPDSRFAVKALQDLQGMSGDKK